MPVNAAQALALAILVLLIAAPAAAVSCTVQYRSWFISSNLIQRQNTHLSQHPISLLSYVLNHSSH